MLNLTAFRNVLSTILSPPRLHTAALFTATGDLLAYASSHNSRSKDDIRILVGVASEIWTTVKEEGVGMVESELGRIVVLPIYPSFSPSSSRVGRPSSRSTSYSPHQEDNNLNPPMLIAINGSDDVEWAEMLVKSRGVVNHLVGSLAAFGERLPRTPSLPVSRIPGRFY